jgi:GPH family glycoside/pentoside/hexuronide:cation symporter
LTAPSPSRPEPTVPAREKLGLGLGFAASQGASNVVYVLSHQVLNVMFGLNPALVTLIGAVQRIWNALLDPFFGRLSDNLRGPLGRRRPLLLIGVLPLAASFVAMWWFPRGWSGPRLFAYSLAASLLLYAAISLYSTALGGLQIEAASGYHERTRLAAFMQLCFLGFTVAAQWIFPLIQGFADPVHGLRELALGAGIFFLAAGLAPVWLARDRLYAWVAARQGRLRFGERLGAVRRNPALVRLLAADGSMSLGFYLSSALGFYLNYYYIYAGDLKGAALMQGCLGTAFQLAAFASVVIFRRLSFRLGKRQAFQAAAACHLAGAAAKLWLFQPAHPSWQIFAYLASGAAYAATEMLSLSMLADVVDLDELRTGVRSEALHWSLLSWVDKICGAAGTLLSGLLLVAVGFDTHRGGAQSADCLLLMRVFYAACPAGGALAAIAILARFPVSEASARAVREELDLRRAAPAA